MKNTLYINKKVVGLKGTVLIAALLSVTACSKKSEDAPPPPAQQQQQNPSDDLVPEGGLDVPEVQESEFDSDNDYEENGQFEADRPPSRGGNLPRNFDRDRETDLSGRRDRHLNREGERGWRRDRVRDLERDSEYGAQDLDYSRRSRVDLLAEEEDRKQFFLEEQHRLERLEEEKLRQQEERLRQEERSRQAEQEQRRRQVREEDERPRFQESEQRRQNVRGETGEQAQEPMPLDSNEQVFKRSKKNPFRGQNLPATGVSENQTGQSRPNQQNLDNQRGERGAEISQSQLSEWEAPKFDKKSPAFSWVYHEVNPLLKILRSSSTPTKQKNTSVVITLALGYFDGYYDKPLVHEGVNYGMVAPVDPWLRSIVDHVLTQTCRGQIQICGFHQVANNGFESVYEKEISEGVAQQIRLISGAITTDHKLNISDEEQKLFSDKSTSAFHGSFLDSDAVIYVGHSRKGGGPDFHPPKLNSQQRVDYNFYQKNRPGVKGLLKAMSKRETKAKSFALLSCDSTDHFVKEIKKVSSRTELTTINGLLQGSHLLVGGLAAADLYLRQGSLVGLNKFVSGIEYLEKNLSVQK